MKTITPGGTLLNRISGYKITEELLSLLTNCLEKARLYERISADSVNTDCSMLIEKVRFNLAADNRIELIRLTDPYFACYGLELDDTLGLELAARFSKNIDGNYERYLLQHQEEFREHLGSDRADRWLKSLYYTTLMRASIMADTALFERAIPLLYQVRDTTETESIGVRVYTERRNFYSSIENWDAYTSVVLNYASENPETLNDLDNTCYCFFRYGSNQAVERLYDLLESSTGYDPVEYSLAMYLLEYRLGKFDSAFSRLEKLMAESDETQVILALKYIIQEKRGY